MNKSILSNRPLITIGISESVSNIGNWITMMAVFAMVVFRGEGGVTQSSGIILAGLLPTLLFSPVAGWLCDRFDRKWLMIGSELASAVITTGLIFVQRLELIYAVLALQAVSIAIMSPARQATLPDLVDKDMLTRANAFLQQLSGIIKVTAPMLAGLVLSLIGPHQAIILDVVSFLLSALILTRLPALPPHREEKPAQADAPAVRTGLGQTLRASASLRLLFVSTFLAIFVIIGFDVLTPVYVRDILMADEGFYGLIIGCVGMGTVAASLALMLRKSNPNPWHELIAGLLLLGIIAGSMFAAIQAGSTALARGLILAGCLLGGIGNGMVNIQISTLLQSQSPPAVLGRVSGAFQGTAVAGQLSGLLVTPLLVPGLLPMGAYFGLAALAIFGLSVFITASLRHTRPVSPVPQLAVK